MSSDNSYARPCSGAGLLVLHRDYGTRVCAMGSACIHAEDGHGRSFAVLHYDQKTCCDACKTEWGKLRRIKNAAKKEYRK